MKERYGAHHGVSIQDAALVAAATLSDRYITTRFLPDKAVDMKYIKLFTIYEILFIL